MLADSKPRTRPSGRGVVYGVRPGREKSPCIPPEDARQEVLGIQGGQVLVCTQTVSPIPSFNYELPYRDSVVPYAEYLKGDSPDVWSPFRRWARQHAGRLRDAQGIACALCAAIAGLRTKSPSLLLCEERLPSNPRALFLAYAARSVGLPSRLCLGYVVDSRGRFRWHYWVELFVGHWVGYDPLSGSEGQIVTARYLCLGKTDLTERGQPAVRKLLSRVPDLSVSIIRDLTNEIDYAPRRARSKAVASLLSPPWAMPETTCYDIVSYHTQQKTGSAGFSLEQVSGGNRMLGKCSIETVIERRRTLRTVTSVWFDPATWNAESQISQTWMGDFRVVLVEGVFNQHRAFFRVVPTLYEEGEAQFVLPGTGLPSYEMILPLARGVPLEKGRRATFEMVAINQTVRVTLEVGERQAVSTEQGEVGCHTVFVTSGKTKTWMWLTESRPHYMLKYVDESLDLMYVFRSASSEKGQRSDTHD